ncbi:MAG TPA: hypothetical protein VK505_04915 [Steroidobacteraceae bacterium]|nr:hypothetical protein [Steroidobacteraceae bacterium]
MRRALDITLAVIAFPLFAVLMLLGALFGSWRAPNCQRCAWKRQNWS